MLAALTSEAQPATDLAWIVYRMALLEWLTSQETGCIASDAVGAILEDILAGAPLSPRVATWVAHYCADEET